jgi:hypothetical protein
MSKTLGSVRMRIGIVLMPINANPEPDLDRHQNDADPQRCI